MLSALDHATGAVLSQDEDGWQVQPEVPVLRDLLEPLGLDGVVVTADTTAHTGRHHHEIPIKTTRTSLVMPWVAKKARARQKKPIVVEAFSSSRASV